MDFIFNKEKKTLSTKTISVIQGENAVTTLNFPKEIDSDDAYRRYIEFRLPQNVRIVDELTPTTDGYKYVVTDTVSAYAGDVGMQLVLCSKQNEEIYKTYRVLGKISVKPSILAAEKSDEDLTRQQRRIFLRLLDEKASLSELDLALSAKADSSDVDTALSAKVSTADFNTALSAKANVSDVDTALSAKVSTTDFNTALSAKADSSDVNTALSAKVSTADFNTALSAKANSSDVTTAVDAHNSSSSSHADVRSAIDAVVGTVSALSASAVRLVSQTCTAEQRQQARSNIGACSLGDVYPVGSIYFSCNATNPAALFGGVWEQLKDRFLLAAGDTYAPSTTGGEATHTLSANEMPSHEHEVNGSDGSAYKQMTSVYGSLHGTAGEYIYSTQYGKTLSWSSAQNYLTKAMATGGGQAHNNMPPYLAVYVWKRTA